MGLPDSTRQDVEHALRERGLGRRIRAFVPVGGGCINNGLRVDTDTDTSFFLKWNANAPVEMFEAEAEGLAALREARAVRVPEPLAWGGSDGTPSWLLLEYINPGATRGDSDERLGRGLAALHDRAARETFGWDHDNWIGAIPQTNARSSSWGDFWHDRRIAPQLDAARSHGHFNDSLLDRLLDVIPAALSDVSSPQLLHGDLWSGNALVADDGEPVVIDPAVYRGDGEVDLAMTELFGGFGAGFYDAYADVRGISAAYRSHRKELYQLYYLLVHVNLFGASYVEASRRAAERALSELT